MAASCRAVVLACFLVGQTVAFTLPHGGPRGAVAHIVRAQPRLCAPYEEGGEEEYEYDETDPDAVEGIPLSEIDWDRAWVHFKLMQQSSKSDFVDNFLSVMIATGAFALILHFYIVSTGGIVLVPEHGLSVYNFNELQKLDPQHLMKLGIPMPAVPQPLNVFQRLQMMAFSSHTG